MKRTASIALLLAFFALTVPVFAQEATPAPVKAAVELKTLTAILVEVSKESGITVVADSSVAQEKIAMPTEPITPDNLDQQLALIVRRLPRGATWAKLYLPEKPTGYKGDDLTDYALAQAKLFGSAGAVVDSASIEVLGQKFGGEKATMVSQSLNLKPIYLIANPTVKMMAKPEKPAEIDWSQMTPEQRQKYSKDQAQKLLSLSDADRAQAMGKMFEQQASVMGSLMQSMTQQQRSQFFQSMSGFMRGLGGNGGQGQIRMQVPRGGG